MTGSAPRNIPCTASLLRRIHPTQVVDDKNTGIRRFSTAAFKDPKMSVDVEEFLADQGLDWRFSLQGYPDYSLARVSVAAVVQHGQTAVHVPLNSNCAHAEVKGKKSPGIANKLLEASLPVFIEGKVV